MGFLSTFLLLSLTAALATFQLIGPILRFAGKYLKNKTASKREKILARLESESNGSIDPTSRRIVAGFFHPYWYKFYQFTLVWMIRYSNIDIESKAMPAVVVNVFSGQLSAQYKQLIQTLPASSTPATMSLKLKFYKTSTHASTLHLILVVLISSTSKNVISSPPNNGLVSRLSVNLSGL